VTVAAPGRGPFVVVDTDVVRMVCALDPREARPVLFYAPRPDQPTKFATRKAALAAVASTSEVRGNPDTYEILPLTTWEQEAG
jgi:hypothetical protein